MEGYGQYQRWDGSSPTEEWFSVPVPSYLGRGPGCLNPSQDRRGEGSTHRSRRGRVTRVGGGRYFSTVVDGGGGGSGLKRGRGRTGPEGRDVYRHSCRTVGSGPEPRVSQGPKGVPGVPLTSWCTRSRPETGGGILSPGGPGEHRPSSDGRFPLGPVIGTPFHPSTERVGPFPAVDPVGIPDVSGPVEGTGDVRRFGNRRLWTRPPSLYPHSSSPPTTLPP